VSATVSSILKTKVTREKNSLGKGGEASLADALTPIGVSYVNSSLERQGKGKARRGGEEKK